MTNEEANRIKAQTIDDLAAERRRRTCLRAKARTIQAEAEAARDLMAKVLASEPSKCVLSHDLWPSFDEVVDTETGIRVADARIRELEQNLRGWGAID